MDEQQNTTSRFDPTTLSDDNVTNYRNKYINYLSENIGLQGETGYSQARAEFDLLNAERAKRIAIKFQETQPDPTMIQKVDAFGRGFNEEMASTLGLLPDVAQNIANTLGMDEGESPFGSKNLSRNLQALGGGYYTSERLPTKTTDPTTLGDMPSKLRPYAVGGEEMFTSASFFAPQAIAARYKSIAPIPVAMEVGKGAAFRRAVDDQVQAYARNPLAYSGVETGVATLQAMGAGLAEQIDPGNPTSRMLGTMAFAPLATATAVAPISFVNSVTREAIPRVTKGVAKVARMGLQGDKGIEAELSKQLNKYLTQVDINPSEVINSLSDVISKKALKEGKLPGTSVGLLTGDKNLIAIESAIINNIPNVKKEAAQEAKKSVTDLNNAFNNLLKIEDANPELVRSIADARIAQINALFSTKVNNEITKLKELQKQTGLQVKDVPTQKARTAREVRNIIEKTADDLQAYENLQWDKLDRTLTAQTNDTQRAISDLIDEGVLPEQLIPKSLSKLRGVRDIGETIDPIKARGVNSGDLIDAKKELSTRIREANRAEDFAKARQLSILQSAVYNDLDNVGKRFGAQLRVANNATMNRYKFYDIDVIKQLTKRTDQGNLPEPDLVLEKNLLGKQQLNYHTFNDLLTATRGAILSKENANPLGKFYLAAANEAINPQGLVNADKLSKFLIKNQQGLKTLGMYDTLSEPRNQALFVKKLQEYHKGISKAPTQQVLERIIKSNDSNSYINKTLFSSSNRRKELLKLSDLIKRKQFHKQDPIQALEGVQYSVLQNLINKSFIERKYTPYGEEIPDINLISGKNIKDLLQKKQGKQGGKGFTTLEQDLLDSKIFNKEQINSIKSMADKAIELEKNLLVREGIAPSEAEELIPKGDALMDIMGRLGGVFAAQASPMISGIGHELVISSIFSKAGKDLMSRLPNDKLKNLLIESTRDPVLMKRLLESAPTPRVVRKRDQFLLNVMVSKKMLTERERYDIEDSLYSANNNIALQNQIKKHLQKGVSKQKIMRSYETVARMGKDNIGEFTLDQVQAILGIDDKERTDIRMSIEGRVKRKRSPKQRLEATIKSGKGGAFGLPTNP